VPQLATVLYPPDNMSACMYVQETTMYSLYTKITKNSLEILMVHCRPGMQQYIGLWNDLPKDLRNTGLSTDTFGKHLKSLLFSAS